MVKIRVKKLDPKAIVPNFAYEGDAGMDLFSIENMKLAPGERASIATGIAMAIPKGYVGLVWDKSGLSHKKGLKTLGGVIDAGFRGECRVGIVNLSLGDIKINKGDKVAQILVQKIERPEIEEVDVLEKTERSDKGFGSSGE